jgi:23S rRNA pseudouridine1911/1915/1917 synthase
MDSDSSPESKPAFQTLTVDPDHAGKRLDRFLVEKVPDLSRARVRALIEQGQVKVNGRRARKGDTVTAGATVEILAPPPPRDFSPMAETELPIVSRYESASIVVLEKPAGMPTHPLRPDETGTLANYIVARYPETSEIGFARREPGLLHRLDTDTSGLVMVARTPEAFESFRTASREGKVHKRYLALVEGRVASEARVDYPLVPHRKDPKRVEAVTPHVRLRAGTRTHEAHTRYKPVRVYRDPTHGREFTLVEVEVETAFRHQVRVHLSTVGHPLLGDALYRGPEVPAGLGLTRHFLHASELEFPDPSRDGTLRVQSPLPDELAMVLDRLKS